MSDVLSYWLKLKQTLKTKSFPCTTNEIVSDIINSLGGIQKIIEIVLKKPGLLTLEQSIKLENELQNLPNKQNQNNIMNIMPINIPQDIIISKIFPYLKFSELIILELISQYFCCIARNPNSLFELYINKIFCDYVSSKNISETDLTRFSKVKKLSIDFPYDISFNLVRKIGDEVIKPSLAVCKKINIVRCGEDNRFMQYFGQIIRKFKGNNMFFYSSSCSYKEVFEYCILLNTKLKSLVLDEPELSSEIVFGVSKIVSFFIENKNKLCKLTNLWIRGDYCVTGFYKFNPARIMLTRQLLWQNSNSLQSLHLIYNDLLYPLWDGEYEYFYLLKDLNTLNLEYYITRPPKR